MFLISKHCAEFFTKYLTLRPGQASKPEILTKFNNEIKTGKRPII